MFKDQFINLCLIGFTVSGGKSSIVGAPERRLSRINVQDQHMRDDQEPDQKSVKSRVIDRTFPGSEARSMSTKGFSDERKTQHKGYSIVLFGVALQRSLFDRNIFCVKLWNHSIALTRQICLLLFYLVHTRKRTTHGYWSTDLTLN
jgi:hypothetical protein